MLGVEGMPWATPLSEALRYQPAGMPFASPASSSPESAPRKRISGAHGGRRARVVMSPVWWNGKCRFERNGALPQPDMPQTLMFSQPLMTQPSSVRGASRQSVRSLMACSLQNRGMQSSKRNGCHAVEQATGYRAITIPDRRWMGMLCHVLQGPCSLSWRRGVRAL